MLRAGLEQQQRHLRQRSPHCRAHRRGRGRSRARGPEHVRGALGGRGSGDFESRCGGAPCSRSAGLARRGAGPAGFATPRGGPAERGALLGGENRFRPHALPRPRRGDTSRRPRGTAGTNSVSLPDRRLQARRHARSAGIGGTQVSFRLVRSGGRGGGFAGGDRARGPGRLARAFGGGVGKRRGDLPILGTGEGIALGALAALATRSPTPCSVIAGRACWRRCCRTRRPHRSSACSRESRPCSWSFPIYR